MKTQHTPGPWTAAWPDIQAHGGIVAELNTIDEPQAALAVLVDCCRHKTGQSYKLRGLLYSLWNGQPYSLLKIVSLDSSLRYALLIVLAHFGAPNFFYDEIKAAFVAAGLLDWFCEQYQPSQPSTPQLSTLP